MPHLFGAIHLHHSMPIPQMWSDLLRYFPLGAHDWGASAYYLCATFRSCWKTRFWQCAAVALRGKMSKIEEDFFGSACYTSQEPDDQSHLPDAERGASSR